MKNVDEPYEKYYNAYKNDYDNDDELSEAKKKNFDYKQFEFFDKTDKKSTLDGKTKKDEKSKLTALPKWLRSKNDFKEAIKLIEDIRADTNNVKSSSGDKKVFNNLDKLINDIKNKKTTRKNTIEKIKNIVSDLDQQRQKESTVFQNKMIDVVYYLFNSLGISTKKDRLMLLEWVKVSKQRFDVIKKEVQNAKINNLQARPKGGKVININESNKLLHEIENSQITYDKALKRIENIRSDINKIISMQSLNLNQINVLNILFMANEIFAGEIESVEVNKEGNFVVFKEKSDIERKESDEQPDTTDMPELESV